MDAKLEAAMAAVNPVTVNVIPMGLLFVPTI